MNVPTSLSVMAATGPSSWSASSISSSDIWSTPASACHTYTSKRTNQDLRCWYIHACSGSIPDITEDRPIGTFLVCFGMSHINQTIKTCVKHRSTHKHRDNISSLTHTSSAIFMGFFFKWTISRRLCLQALEYFDMYFAMPKAENDHAIRIHTMNYDAVLVRLT